MTKWLFCVRQADAGSIREAEFVRENDGKTPITRTSRAYLLAVHTDAGHTGGVAPI